MTLVLAGKVNVVKEAEHMIRPPIFRLYEEKKSSPKLSPSQPNTTEDWPNCIDTVNKSRYKLSAPNTS